MGRGTEGGGVGRGSVRSVRGGVLARYVGGRNGGRGGRGGGRRGKREKEEGGGRGRGEKKGIEGITTVSWGRNGIGERNRSPVNWGATGGPGRGKILGGGVGEKGTGGVDG